MLVRYRSRLVAPLMLAGLAIGGAPVLLGAIRAAPGPAQPPSKEVGPPGWFARYTPAGAPKSAQVLAHSPMGAFALQPGQTIYPGIPAAGFAAMFDALVKIPEPGKYRFGFEAEGGAAKLTIFGAAITEPIILTADTSGVVGPGATLTAWIDLPAGGVNLQYTFTRKDDQRARLRPVWEMERRAMSGFRLEPIPADAVQVPPFGREGVAAFTKAWEGRILLGELGCVQCHAASPAAQGALFPAKAPLLGEVGRHAQPEWLRRWITAPQALEPGCGMPGILTDAPKDAADAETIVHFLVSLGGPAAPESAAKDPGTIDQGRTLYNQVGCIACHGPAEKDAALEPTVHPYAPPEPFGAVAGEWNPSALAGFLCDPVRTHPGGRMPSMNLDKPQADLIATYLITIWGDSNSSTKTVFVVDKAKADAGRAAFAARGCAGCHTLGLGAREVASTLKAKPLAELTTKGGCLRPTDTATPRYTLTDADRIALGAAIAQLKPLAKGAPAVAPVDDAYRHIDALGCRHCHEYNASGGVDPAINAFFQTLAQAELGDEGRLPPRLNGVGTKLKSSWLRQVLTRAGRARPYMGATMPQFGLDTVGSLADELTAADGVWPDSDKGEPRVTDELTQAGLKLIGVKGLNCISCHVVGDAPSAGTPGPDIAAFAERLRHEWWINYVLAPNRYKPGTRMPTFYLTGTGSVTDVLGGQPERQADAMWACFTLGKSMPAPEGIPTSDGLMLRVGTKPIVIRTFLKSAGSRGIAVGFPAAMGGIHFAFDAERVRLAEAWSGSFLDASGAWAARGGTIVGGQGTDVWTPPDGPAIVIGPKPDAWPATSGREAGYKFRGYRLDDAGVPTFMYRIALPDGKSVDVNERFEPVKGTNPAIRRTFEMSGVPAGVQVWHNAGSGHASIAASDVSNATAVTQESSGGLHWWGFTPTGAGPVRFAVEIKP